MRFSEVLDSCRVKISMGDRVIKFTGLSIYEPINTIKSTGKLLRATVLGTAILFLNRVPCHCIENGQLLCMDQEPRHFYLTVWGQKVWGWFLDQNFVLNLKIHFLQMADGGFGMKSAFLGDFGTFLYVNSHNGSLYQISVRPWQIWYQIEAHNSGRSFVCSFGSFSGCHGNGSQELNKNWGKMGIFRNLCDT